MSDQNVSPQQYYDTVNPSPSAVYAPDSVVVPPEVVTPNYPMDAGGPLDVNSAIRNSQIQSTVNPAPSFGEERYQQYKSFFDNNQPGLPDFERERMALEAAGRDVDSKAATEQTAILNSQSADVAKAQQIEKQNLMRAKLGMAPLDVPAIPGAQSVQPEVTAPEFDKPQTQQQATDLTQLYTPSDTSNVLAPYSQQQQSIKAIANAEAQQESLKQIEQAKLEDKLQEEEKKRQDLQVNFDREYKARTAELETLSNELKGQDFTVQKVDKNRLWNNMGTGRRILAGISLALGAGGASLTGGPNYALEIINKAIDRDIDEQKTNISSELDSRKLKAQSMRDRMNVGQSMLSDLRQKYGDDIQATLAFRDLALKQTQLQFEKMASSTAVKTIAERAKYNIAEIEKQRQAIGLQLKSEIAKQVLRKQAALNGGQMTPEQEAMFSKEDQQAFKDRRERTVDGVGLAFDGEAAKAARKVVSGSNNMITLLDKIMELRKKATPIELANPATAVHKQLTALSGELLGAKKEAETLGTLDKGVEGLVNKIYENPTGFNPNISEQYKFAKKLQIKKAQNSLAVYVGKSQADKYAGPGITSANLDTLSPRK